MRKVILACSSQKAVLKTQTSRIYKEEKYILCCALTSCSMCSHSGNIWTWAGHSHECRQRSFKWLESEALELLPLKKLNLCLNLNPGRQDKRVVSNKGHPIVGHLLILRWIRFGAKQVDSFPLLKIEVVSPLWYIQSLLPISVSAVIIMLNIL